MIELINVNKEFDSKVIYIDTNIKFNKGLNYLYGPSGTGKTTLINLISGLDQLNSGSILIDGIDITKLSKPEINNFRKDNICIIFQDFNLIETLNVYDNIALPLRLRKVNEEEIFENISNILKITELTDFINSDVNTLSEGEKQKVAIARSLTTKPLVLLADEITGNLDVDSKNEIMNIIKRISEDIIIIFSTHETSLSKKFSGNEYYLKDNTIIGPNIKEDTKQISRTNEFSSKDNLSLSSTIGLKTLIKDKSLYLFLTVLITFFLTLTITLSTITSFKIDKSFKDISSKNNINHLEFIQNSNDPLKEAFYFKNKKEDLNDVLWAYKYEDESLGNIIFINNDTNLNLLSGSMPLNKNEIVISNYKANKDNLNINSEVILNGSILTIVGITNDKLNKTNHLENIKYLESIFMREEAFLKIRNNPGIKIDVTFKTLKMDNMSLNDKISFMIDDELNGNEVLFPVKYKSKGLSERMGYFFEFRNLNRTEVLIKQFIDSEYVLVNTNTYNKILNSSMDYIGITSSENLGKFNNTFYVLNNTVIKLNDINNNKTSLFDVLLPVTVILLIIITVIMIVLVNTIYQKDKKMIGILKVVGFNHKEITMTYLIKFTIVSILSVIITLILSNSIIKLFDSNFGAGTTTQVLFIYFNSYLITLIMLLLTVSIILTTLLYSYNKRKVIELIK